MLRPQVDQRHRLARGLKPRRHDWRYRIDDGFLAHETRPPCARTITFATGKWFGLVRCGALLKPHAAGAADHGVARNAKFISNLRRAILFRIPQIAQLVIALACPDKT